MGPPSMPRFRDGLDRADRLSMTLATRARPLAQVYWRLARRTVLRRPESFIAEFEKELSVPDRVVIADPELGRQFLVDTTQEALRESPSGVVDDWAIAARDWGFGLDQIAIHTRLWHGDADESVPLFALAARGRHDPDSELTVLRGEGHLLLNHFPELFRALTTP